MKNKKNFKTWSNIWAIVWAIFAGYAKYKGYDLGVVATLGGIALMFAWNAQMIDLKS
mgnify:CR=1 FL=1